MSNVSSTQLKWTGERYLPEIEGGIELEHKHRYLIARELVQGLKCLDVASGEGYGSALLADRAKHVIGVDIARDAIEQSKSRYQRPNLQFLQGSASNIPLPSASVEAVVSFETIEHHDQHDQMMREISRVLTPNGWLLISSPDRETYNIDNAIPNHFHVKELYAQEFFDLLNRHFSSIKIFGQKVEFASVIWNTDGKPCEMHSMTLPATSTQWSSGIEKPVYWLALASNGPLPELQTGLLSSGNYQKKILNELERVNREYSLRDMEVIRLNGEIERIQHEYQNGQTEITRLNDELARVLREYSLRDMEVTRLNQEIERIQHEYLKGKIEITRLNNEIQRLKVPPAAK